MMKVYVNKSLDQKAHEEIQPLIDKLQSATNYNSQQKYFFTKQIYISYAFDLNPTDDDFQELAITDPISSAATSPKVSREFTSTFHGVITALTEGSNALGSLGKIESLSQTRKSEHDIAMDRDLGEHLQSYSGSTGERYLRGKITINEKHFSTVLEVLKAKDHNLGLENQELNAEIDKLKAERQALLERVRQPHYIAPVGCQIASVPEKFGCPDNYDVVFPNGPNHPVQRGEWIFGKPSCGHSKAEAQALVDSAAICHLGPVIAMGACFLGYDDERKTWITFNRNNALSDPQHDVSGSTALEQEFELMSYDKPCGIADYKSPEVIDNNY